MRLVPVYTPDPDYIDRQIEAELHAEQRSAPVSESEIPRVDHDRIAS